jgi:SAM-dependent methyltransferase
MKTSPVHAAAIAFDSLASEYDDMFTYSSIGRVQRRAVMQYAVKVFRPESRLLELNCGTGEDALHFANLGLSVTACDASAAMVMQARRKAAKQDVSGRLQFHVQTTEKIGELLFDQQFGGVFSNFSGLNCVRDLADVGRALAPLLLPRSPVLLCVSTRYCVWEIFYYLLRGDLTRALRRCRGSHQKDFGGVTVPLYYPTSRAIEQSFSSSFRIVSIRGVGITVPPSYLESWMVNNPRLLGWLDGIDSAIRTWPFARTFGDHMLLHFERLPA